MKASRGTNSQEEFHTYFPFRIPSYIAYMSDVRSSAEKTMITREQAFSIIKEAGMKSRDLKLVSDCLEKDEKYQRHIVSPRTTSNSVIFFLEHLKVI